MLENIELAEIEWFEGLRFMHNESRIHSQYHEKQTQAFDLHLQKSRELFDNWRTTSEELERLHKESCKENERRFNKRMKIANIGLIISSVTSFSMIAVSGLSQTYQELKPLIPYILWPAASVLGSTGIFTLGYLRIIKRNSDNKSDALLEDYRNESSLIFEEYKRANEENSQNRDRLFKELEEERGKELASCETEYQTRLSNRRNYSIVNRSWKLNN